MTGPLTLPHTLLLGRYDDDRLRMIARSTPLPTPLRHEVGAVLAAPSPDHPWMNVTFSPAWGTREALEHRRVRPSAVVEFEGDAAVAAGRYRHPVGVRRLRPDLSPDELPVFGEN
ncbi:hypothetical protein OIE63_39370 (plasmid) [Streptomyces sp. NBC_01795]|uniref:hypothetical protein n=1 Tax=unclassified Streptomyces TaxID=2593676 RepID=UPI002DD7CE4B|nr:MULTISPECIES: hypothetical protein [unclassified Streptomyces]WSA97586.1 hypothetical protein OIE63_39370 [Streptomyces sp. NBC_01795]WSB82166.1 hypothetical protein OHB04_41445 [Streptomyces sp. NBC_01775]WSS18137.1 hypothetical protein OG533_40525 [Streptomyces sp. NBC_01186]